MGVVEQMCPWELCIPGPVRLWYEDPLWFSVMVYICCKEKFLGCGAKATHICVYQDKFQSAVRNCTAPGKWHPSLKIHDLPGREWLARFLVPGMAFFLLSRSKVQLDSRWLLPR